jgi:hypothetical protein
MLQRQPISIPVNSSIDTKSDPFLTSAESSLVSENTRFFKTGALVKRNGFAPINTGVSTYTSAGGKLKRVVSDGQLMLASGNAGINQTLAYSDSRDKWENLKVTDAIGNVGGDLLSISPVACELLNQLSGDGDVGSYWFDKYQGETLVLVNISSYNSTTGAVKIIPTLFIIDDATGATKKINTPTLNTVGQSQFGACCILVIGGVKYYVYAVATTGGAPNTLSVSFFNASTMVETIVSDALFTTPAPIALCPATDRASFYVVGKATATAAQFVVSRVDNTGSIDSVTVTIPASGVVSTTRLPGICMAGSNVAVGVSDVASSTTDVLIYLFDSALTQLDTYSTNSNNGLTGSDVFLGSDGTYLGVAYNSSDETRAILNRSTLPSLIPSQGGFLDGGRVIGGCSFYNSNPYALIVNSYLSSDVPYKTAFLCGAFDRPAGDAITPVSYFAYDRVSPSSRGCSLIASGNNIYCLLPLAVRADSVSGVSVTGTSVINVLQNNITDRATLFEFNMDGSSLSGATVSVGDMLIDAYGYPRIFDGSKCFPIGFPARPVLVSLTGSASGGSIAAGTYKYIVVMEMYDTSGRILLSQQSNEKSVTTTGSTSSVRVDFTANPLNNVSSYKVTVYRTKAGAGIFFKVDESAFYLEDAVSGVTMQITDTVVDSGISTSARILYTTGGVLENGPPPPVRHATIHQDRVFIVPSDELNKVYYSKKIGQDQLPAFSPNLFIQSFSGNPKIDDKITGCSSVGDKLILFRRESTYWIAGDGANDVGTLSTFGEPEKLSIDIGCTETRSIIEMPLGTMFKSAKGIYLIGQDLSMSYIGAGVEIYNSEVIRSSILIKERNIVQFATSSRLLTYDYLMQKWSVDTIGSIQDVTVYNGKTVILKSTDSFGLESSAYVDDFGEMTPPSVQMKMVTGWLKLSGIQDFARITRLLVLGRYYSAHNLVIKVYYDYNDSLVETFTIPVSSNPGQYQYKVHLARQKCQSIKIEVSDSGTGQSLDLTGITLEVGVKQGTFKTPAARQY